MLKLVTCVLREFIELPKFIALTAVKGKMFTAFMDV